MRPGHGESELDFRARGACLGDSGAPAWAAPPPRAAATCERQARTCLIRAVREPRLAKWKPGKARAGWGEESGVGDVQRLHKRGQAVLMHPRETVVVGKLCKTRRLGPLKRGVVVGPSESRVSAAVTSPWDWARAVGSLLHPTCVLMLDLTRRCLELL